MNTKFKESKKSVKEIKFDIGEILEFKDGMSVYVIPLKKLDKLKSSQLEKIKDKIKAKQLIEQADKLTEQRIKQGWTEEDFRHDFWQVQKQIAQFLNKKKHVGKRKQIL